VFGERGSIISLGQTLIKQALQLENTEALPRSCAPLLAPWAYCFPHHPDQGGGEGLHGRRGEKVDAAQGC
jgi:hypothetical protein